MREHEVGSRALCRLNNLISRGCVVHLTLLKAKAYLQRLVPPSVGVRSATLHGILHALSQASGTLEHHQTQLVTLCCDVTIDATVTARDA